MKQYITLRLVQEMTCINHDREAQMGMNAGSKRIHQSQYVYGPTRFSWEINEKNWSKSEPKPFEILMVLVFLKETFANRLDPDHQQAQHIN